MKILKYMVMSSALFSANLFALEFCPNQRAIDEGGFLKSVEVCQYEEIQTNLKTSCSYHGKLGGDFGLIIFRQNTSHSGHSSCSSEIYEATTVCRDSEFETDPHDEDSPYPKEPGTPTQLCSDYKGYLQLNSQTYDFDVVQKKIPNSCHTSREWVRCKP